MHIATASLALLTGGVVLFRRKGTAPHKKTGILYFICMVIANITALFIYNINGDFLFPHWLAVVTLIAVVPGYLFSRFKRFKYWLQAHLICFVLSYYLLIGGAINEVFLHVGSLKPYLTNGHPLFHVTHVLTQMLFIGLLIYFLISSRKMVSVK